MENEEGVLEVGEDGSFEVVTEKKKEEEEKKRARPCSRLSASGFGCPGLANAGLPIPSILFRRLEGEDDEFYDAAGEESELGKDAMKAKKYKDQVRFQSARSIFCSTCWASIKMLLALEPKGNEQYKMKLWEEAADFYTLAIDYCPAALAEERAVYYGNRAACFLQLQDYEQVISDCGQALEAQAGYMKALMRRAQAYEKQEKYDLALADQLALLEIDPGLRSSREAKPRLERLQAEKNEKMKDEAIGKLKELGNSLLSNFGLSLDNFKVNQQDGGGYNISFNQDK
jgi:tetratricopeptide (TPR) repeat protein